MCLFTHFLDCFTIGYCFLSDIIETVRAIIRMPSAPLLIRHISALDLRVGLQVFTFELILALEYVFILTHELVVVKVIQGR